jgi:hypothetical protein
VRLPGASTWLECLTSGRVTVLKPSLNLFGDFLEISAARGKAFHKPRRGRGPLRLPAGFLLARLSGRCGKGWLLEGQDADRARRRPTRPHQCDGHHKTPAAVGRAQGASSVGGTSSPSALAVVS